MFLFNAAIKDSNEEIKNSHTNSLKVLEEVKENLKQEREFLTTLTTNWMNEVKEFESIIDI